MRSFNQAASGTRSSVATAWPDSAAELLIRVFENGLAKGKPKLRLSGRLSISLASQPTVAPVNAAQT